MKRFASITLVLLMLVSVLAGCGAKSAEQAVSFLLTSRSPPYKKFSKLKSSWITLPVVVGLATPIVISIR